MPAKLDNAEGVLVARLGVYGCWILKHGQRIGEMPESQPVKDAYSRWLLEGDSVALALMGAIDAFCASTGTEGPLSKYENALRDLVQFRGGS